MRRNPGVVIAFVVGLTAIGWVGFGYIGSNPLALTMTLLIGAVYLMGARELHRFRQATASLDRALLALPERLVDLGEWLGQVEVSLRNPVRLRIDGERGGLPGPAMTPYLVGLLVLLGMLGTFVGMVVTLNGTVLALEGSSDLATMRAALAAPVRGLGLAFGTSVAGVAASAMLGLVSAFCRRERLQAAQALDSQIATSLHPFSHSHQRQQTLQTLQLQAAALPEMVATLQSMMAQLRQQGETLNHGLLAGQDRFHAEARGVYGELAASVERSLQRSVSEGARAAAAAIEPAVEATMSGIARESSLFQRQLTTTVEQQLDGLTQRFDTTVTSVADVWARSLSRHELASEALVGGLQLSLAGFNDGLAQHTDALLAAVDDRQAAAQARMQTALGEMAQHTTSLHDRLTDSARLQMEAVTQAFGATAASVCDGWRDALAQQQRSGASLADGHRESLTTLLSGFGQQSAALLATVERSHAELQAGLASNDQQRLVAWTCALQQMTDSLQLEWQRSGAVTLDQQQQICRTLEQTARDIQAQAEVHAGRTIDEMSRLIATASEAPRAAAEVVGLLREKLSDSLARDNDLLDERSRIIGTLSALLDTVNDAATRQRDAIDALVDSSAALLERCGTQFSATIEAQSAQVEAVAAQVAGSAVEVASVGESFSVAVQLFGEASESLVVQLQSIEGALARSTARSDEQLGYYVAQAREIIDLSISSQRQIVDDLQQLSLRQAPLAGAVI